MKNIFKSISLAAGCLLAGAALQSCALDQPFGTDGDGILQMKLVINSNVTRAENDEDALRENCVVYISSTKGLIHKYVGLENVPEQLDMKAGYYVAEAWTGDSVTASFDKKFFRGYEPFEITSGVNSVVLTCKIQNVVVSINSTALKEVPMTEYNIKVENSRGSLDFTEENYETSKGYFMMPNDDTTLKVTVTGKNDIGQEFTKEQLIEGVERAHEYVLNLVHNPNYDENGGGFLTITVDASEVLVESQVELYGRPEIKGSGFDIDDQIYAEKGSFSTHVVKVKAFGEEVESLVISSDDYSELNLASNYIDLKKCTDAVAETLKETGIDWEETYNEENNLSTLYLYLYDTFLNNIPERDTEYRMTLTATDKYGKSYGQDVRIAVGEGAIVIDDPVTIEAVNQDANPMAVTATKATITGALITADAVDPGIEYRVADSGENWSFVAAPESALRAVAKKRGMSAARILKTPGTAFTVTLTGLKPGTRYEYRAVAEDFASDVEYFTTEETFTIPYADMESWTYCDSNIRIPGENSVQSYWDNGNHGSMTLGVTLTQESTEMVHSGSYAAQLKSQYVAILGIGKFAAGNLFVGTYAGTSGTNGIIDFGQPYNGSHPSKLRLWANYRGGSEFKGSGQDVLTNTSGDYGQIYVAFTTGIIRVDTSDDTSLFDPSNSKVLGYGEVTWNNSFGEDGVLSEVEIPVEWYDAAYTTKPTHLIIVCSASKYGDYFTGYVGSTMYVDDFELVYE